MKTFCTITTFSHLHKVMTLGESIQKNGSDITLQVLVVDRETEPDFLIPGIEWHLLDQLKKIRFGESIIGKYSDDPDRIRWCLKSVFLLYQLEELGYSEVIYLDNDQFMVNNYEFIFENLQDASVLLTPHWRCSDPFEDPVNFENNFIDGIYNAGFVGVTKRGIPAMEWWAKACLFACEVDHCRGFHDDQKYLDLLHSRFEGVRVLRHKGCNLADWNLIECQRTPGPDGNPFIRPSFPIVFIHFTNSTISAIEEGRDFLLKPYLASYRNRLRFYSGFCMKQGEIN